MDRNSEGDTSPRDGSEDTFSKAASLHHVQSQVRMRAEMDANIAAMHAFSRQNMQKTCNLAPVVVSCFHTTPGGIVFEISVWIVQF